MKTENLFNKINIIIRPISSRNLFISYADQTINQMLFNVYVQSFDKNTNEQISLYLYNHNTKRKALLYKGNFNEYGFDEVDKKYKKTKVNVTINKIDNENGYCCDLLLDLYNIKFKDGKYDIKAYDKDNKLMAYYSFAVNNIFSINLNEMII